MSKREVYDCDGCRKINLKEAFGVHYVVGTVVDSPSGRTEDVTQELHFCGRCLARRVQEKVSLESVQHQRLAVARALGEECVRE